MPYASKAQQRKFHAMEARGEISKATVNEYDKATDFKNLPERAKDREGRVSDGKGNFVIHGPARKDHGHNRRDGKQGSFDSKTGKVEYEEKSKKADFRFDE